MEAHLLAVLRIDLIMWKLETFLELEDLKHMRVSRAMNQLILCQTKFLSKSKLILRGSAYKSPCFKTITFRPKNVAFKVLQVGSDEDVFKYQVGKREEIIHLICKLVESCEYLEIMDGGWLKDLARASRWGRNNLDGISLPEYFPSIADVILSVTNLKELKCWFGSQVLLNKATEEHEYALSGLKKLEFVVDERDYFNTSDYNDCPPIFLKLKGLMTILGRPCNEDGCSDSTECERFRDLVVNNRETLVELDLGSYCKFCCLKYFINVFPSLKSLNTVQLCSYETEDESLVAATFLRNHLHQLKALALHITKQINPSEHSLWGVYSNCATPCLKKLELIFESEVERTSLINCMTTIRNSSIQDFKLRVGHWYRHDYETELVDIFSLLPKSLRSLILEGNSPPLSYDSSRLKDFPHLTHLKIDTFVGPLNSTLETIFKYLVKLKSVDINCKADVSETESRSEIEPGDNPTGSPILAKTFALKDLESLKIHGEGTVSMDFINVIKSPKLETFCVEQWNLSPEDLCGFFQDCPCLESIGCTSSIQRRCRNSKYLRKTFCKQQMN